MKLSTKELLAYDTDGFLFFPKLFTKNEVDAFMVEALSICAQDRVGRIIEQNGIPHSIYLTPEDKLFFKLSHLPQLVEPARQILRDEVYVHQSKLNPKVALHGSSIEWHQDFIYWHKFDGMPQPRLITAAVFLQDVDESNAPLLVIPGSHNLSVQETDSHQQQVKTSISTVGLSWDSNSMIGNSTVVGKLKYSLDTPTQFGTTLSVLGEAGSVIFFHGNLIHASMENRSSRDRYLVFITYNSVSNALDEIDNPRPEFIASRNFTPIKPLSSNALLT